MRSPVYPCAVALALAALTPGRAVAQSDYSIHATGSTANGFTSNVDNAPSDDDPTTADPEAGLFGTVTPGVLLTFISPRTTQQVTYDLTYSYFLTQEGGDSLVHRLSWLGQFQTSPRTGLNLGTQMSLGQVNPVVAEEELQAPGFTPPGQTNISTVSAVESFEFQWRPDWRFSQAASANFASSEPAEGNFETTAQTFNLDVGADHTFRIDTVGLHLRGTFIKLKTTNPLAGQPDLDSDQINLVAEGRWSHEWLPRWGSTFAGGVTRTQSPNGEFDPVTRPSGSASLEYTPDWGSLRVQYSRAVAVDLFLAQNTLSDIVTFNAFAPVWRFDESVLIGGATAGWGRFEAFGAELGEARSKFDAYNAGLSATWQPMEEPYGATLSYVYVRQDADQDLPMPLTTFSRHTILLTVFGRYPYRRAGQLTELDRQRAAREGRRGAEDTRINERTRN